MMKFPMYGEKNVPNHQLDISIPYLYHGTNYPLAMTNIAIENGQVEIVSFPIKSGDFP